MPQFRVTLNFSVNIHHSEGNHFTSKENKIEWSARQAAFERTDVYYIKHDLEDYIKTYDAMGMVEHTICNGEVLSATWDEDEFAIHMVVETNQTAEELKEDLEMNSLEDGEYEACGESGWILFTRGPDGEVFEGGEGSEDVWEYGLTDYRDNDIEIEAI